MAILYIFKNLYPNGCFACLQVRVRIKLPPYLSGQQMNDLKGVFDDAHGQKLLAVVAAVHHHGACQTLHYGALCLTKAFNLVALGAVGKVLGILLLDGDVILKKEQIMSNNSH